MAEPLSTATRELGKRIRQHRLALDLSQERLANAAGLHWTFIGQCERGQRNISLHNLLKLAHGLKVDPGELVRGLKAPRA